jgi:hypothetical protein
MSYGPPQPYAQPKPAGGGNTVLIVVAIVLVVLLLVAGLCVLGLVAAMFPAVSAARTAAKRVQSQMNLQQIGMAMIMYEQDHRSLPPPFLADKAGKPGVSWRVMLLPYIEQSNLNNMYNRNEAWNSPANQLVRSSRIKMYESPQAADQTPGMTNYVVVVGPNTAFTPGKRIGMDNIAAKDGTSNTILVLEIANSDIAWSEPRDLDFNALTFAKMAPPGSKNVLVAGAAVEFADGSVKYLPPRLTLEQLKAALTMDCGEQIAF